MKKKEELTTHSPEELLSTADHLIDSGDQRMYRSAVLEAFTALEYFVGLYVFGILDSKLDKLLVKWLKEKTRTNFDDRLEVFTPVATEVEIDKNGDLWRRYKKSKEIRNKVAHTGRMVSHEEAKFVRDTVHDWLAYLGSIAGIEYELLRFKEYFETSRISTKKGSELEQEVNEYFSQNNKIEIVRQKQIGNNIADIVLDYGGKTILIENIFLPNLEMKGDTLKRKRILVKRMMHQMRITRGAIIVFHEFELPETVRTLSTIDGGNLSIIYVKVNYNS